MGDAAAGERKKALRIAAVDGDGATTRASVPPVEHEQHHRSAPSPAAAAAAGVATSACGSAAAQSCGEEEEEDDEQVERFYALLANIRALRGLYRAAESRSPPATGRGMKRSREAEALWRPAFRMEDFEEEVSRVTGDAGCAVKKQGTSSGAVGARRPAVARATAADDHHHEEDDAADEARGRKLGRRVAARGSPTHPVEC